MNPMLTRRGLLRGLGASACLAPLAAGLAAERAHAAPPRRALFVYVPDGCIPSLWHPTGGETDFVLPSMSAPLEPIRDDLVFLSGLSMYGPGSSHEGGIAKLLTGGGEGGVSLDILLGEELGRATPHRSLQLGVGTTFQNSSRAMSFVGAGQPVYPDDDPLNAFARLFGGVDVGDDERALNERRQRSVLDAALGDLRALRARLGTTERAKLDQHLDALREVEGRLGQAAGQACELVDFNRTGFAVDPGDRYPKTYHLEERFQQVGRLQGDLATLALSCGATNVVSLMWSHPVSPTRIPESGASLGNHDASHYGSLDSDNARDFIALKRWFMEEFVHLVEQLRAIPDGDGSLLDSTLILLGSELGDGDRHDHDDCPFVLAGGGLRGGRALRYGGTNGGDNEPHSKLLVSFAQQLGVDLAEFGYTGHGTGGLNGL